MARNPVKIMQSVDASNANCIIRAFGAIHFLPEFTQIAISAIPACFSGPRGRRFKLCHPASTYDDSHPPAIGVSRSEQPLFSVSRHAENAACIQRPLMSWSMRSDRRRNNFAFVRFGFAVQGRSAREFRTADQTQLQPVDGTGAQNETSLTSRKLPPVLNVVARRR
jgi:hypothetical protein